MYVCMLIVEWLIAFMLMFTTFWNRCFSPNSDGFYNTMSKQRILIVMIHKQVKFNYKINIFFLNISMTILVPCKQTEFNFTTLT